MAPVGAFMAAYSGVIGAAATAYSAYSQNAAQRKLYGLQKDQMSANIVPTGGLSSSGGAAPVSDPAQREADYEAQVVTNRRRMAASAKRPTIASSLAGVKTKANVEKKTLLGQTGAMALGIV